VTQGGECLRFALEAGEALGVLRKRLWQDFECDRPIEFRVSGTVDFAHPARTNLGGHFIRAEARAQT
jgi:hypothetical protein